MDRGEQEINISGTVEGRKTLAFCKGFIHSEAF